MSISRRLRSRRITSAHKSRYHTSRRHRDVSKRSRRARGKKGTRRGGTSSSSSVKSAASSRDSTESHTRYETYQINKNQVVKFNRVTRQFTDTTGNVYEGCYVKDNDVKDKLSFSAKKRGKWGIIWGNRWFVYNVQEGTLCWWDTPKEQCGNSQPSKDRKVVVDGIQKVEQNKILFTSEGGTTYLLKRVEQSIVEQLCTVKVYTTQSQLPQALSISVEYPQAKAQLLTDMKSETDPLCFNGKEFHNTTRHFKFLNNRWYYIHYELRHGLGTYVKTYTFSELLAYTRANKLVIGRDSQRFINDTSISRTQVEIYMKDGYVNLKDKGPNRTILDSATLRKKQTLTKNRTVPLPLEAGFSDPETPNEYGLYVGRDFFACIVESLHPTTHASIHVAFDNDLPITCDSFPDNVTYSCEGTQYDGEVIIYEYTKQQFIDAFTQWIDKHVGSDASLYKVYRQTQQAYRSHTIALNHIHRNHGLPPLPYCSDSTFSTHVTHVRLIKQDDKEGAGEFERLEHTLTLPKSTTVHGWKHRIAIECGIPPYSKFTIGGGDYDEHIIPVVEQIGAVEDEQNTTLNVNISPHGLTQDEPKGPIHITYDSDNIILNVRVGRTDGTLVERLSGIYKPSTTLADSIRKKKQEGGWPLRLTDTVTYFFKNHDLNNRLEYGTQTVLTKCPDIYAKVMSSPKNCTTMLVNNGFVFYATPKFEWCPTLIYTDNQGVYRITADESKKHDESHLEDDEEDEKYYGEVVNGHYQGNVQFENLDSIHIGVDGLDSKHTDLGYFSLTETVMDIKRKYEEVRGTEPIKQELYTHDGIVQTNNNKISTFMEMLPLTIVIKS